MKAAVGAIFILQGRPLWRGSSTVGYFFSFGHMQSINLLSASILTYLSCIRSTEDERRCSMLQSYNACHEVEEGSQRAREKDDCKFLRA